MHIPDGFLHPTVSYGLLGAAAAVLSYSLAKAREIMTVLAPAKAFALAGGKVGSLAEPGRRLIDSRKIASLGLVASIVFLAQVFDFPVVGATTGHLLLCSFSVIVLGPYAGTLAIAAVLVVQAVFLADGGLIALGTNIINMAFVGGFVCYYLYARSKKFVPDWLAIGAATWVSVVLMSMAFALETGAGSLIKVHLIVGLAEALITIVLVRQARRLPCGEESPDSIEQRAS